METKIFETYRDFLLRDDEDVNGVSPDFAKQYPDWEEKNRTNTGCWNCYGCRNCAKCKNCWDCWNCASSEKLERCMNLASSSDCINCDYASNIHGFRDNPQRIVLPAYYHIQTTYYFSDEQDWIVNSWFIGTLEEYEKKVERLIQRGEPGFHLERAMIRKAKIFKKDIFSSNFKI